MDSSTPGVTYVPCKAWWFMVRSAINSTLKMNITATMASVST